MKIAVQGLWHLGSVTAACLAQAGFATIGIDSDADVVRNLQQGTAPLFEPGLDELIQSGLAAGRLDFTTDMAAAEDCDLVWVAFDTPVDDEDKADIAWVMAQMQAMLPHLMDGATMLISSQLPAGSTRRLLVQSDSLAPGRRLHFAYSPENLRLGKALSTFREPERIVVGVADDAARPSLETVLGRFCSNLLWMSPESAEMAKHALNAFLATCVTFANELATVCETVGADAADVERALRSEPRVGPRAYIRPGGAFAGGTLARDVQFLGALAASGGNQIPMLDAILGSNANHRDWPLRKVRERLRPGTHVAVLGLSYKPGTDAIRRSIAIELCRGLLADGYVVRAHDPKVSILPAELAAVELCPSLQAALQGADALVVATEWPEFRGLTGQAVRTGMRQALVIDQTGFLTGLSADSAINYVTVGKGVRA